MDVTPPPASDMPAAVAGWIHRLRCLRDDVGFDLDRRGIAHALDDVLADMQETRKRAGL